MLNEFFSYYRPHKYLTVDLIILDIRLLTIENFHVPASYIVRLYVSVMVNIIRINLSFFYDQYRYYYQRDNEQGHG
jgi:hypothetical protein